MTESVLPEADFQFTSAADPGARWRVMQFHVHEALSELYEATVDLAETGRTELEALLGQPAELTVTRGSLVRRVCGIVRAAEDFGSTPAWRHVRVHLAPSLWLLTQRKDARIFQDLTVLEVVKEVLAAASLYQEEARLDDAGLDPAAYPRRECCVQYQETDFAFVARLLEDEGITYYFRHEVVGEALVLASDAVTDAFARGVSTLDEAPVRVMGEGGATHHAETVRRLELTLSLQPTGVVLREWDFTRPFAADMASPSREMATTSAHPRDLGTRVVYEYPARATLHEFDVAGGHYGRDDLARRAALRFNEHDARRSVGRGTSVVSGFAPGLRTSLVNEDGDAVGPFVLTSVEHTGLAAAEDDPEPPRDEARYANSFEFIPVDKVFRPARFAPRPQLFGPQTATVMAQPGSREEVCVDVYGRVLVRFHWERPELRSEGQRARGASCWVRVAQAWAGDGWGVAFNPRVGMEVVVQFLDGDPDRPIVTGCVYNRHNPPPPAGEVVERRTRSTIRTRSSPGGAGFNELSFEDLAGRERVYLHAQRDLDEVVLNEHHTQVGSHRHDDVGGDHNESVGGDQRLAVSGRRVVRVERALHTNVNGPESRTVAGPQVVSVEGARRETVGGDHALLVSGSARLRAALGVGVEAGKDFGLDVGRDVSIRAHRDLRESVAGDATLIVRGDRAVVVTGVQSTALHGGTSAVVTGDVQVSATGRIVVTGDEGLVLRCGQASIELREDEVHIRAPRVTVRGDEEFVARTNEAKVQLDSNVRAVANDVAMESSGARLELTTEASLRGAKVKFGSGAGGALSERTASESTTTERREWAVRLTEYADAAGEPPRALADCPFTARGHGPEDFHGVTDAGGVARIPVIYTSCLIDVAVDGRRFRLHAGGIAPIDEERGVRQRLCNLGFGAGSVDGWDEAATREALESFQRFRGLAATGVLTDETREALEHDSQW